MKTTVLAIVLFGLWAVNATAQVLRWTYEITPSQGRPINDIAMIGSTGTGTTLWVAMDELSDSVYAFRYFWIISGPKSTTVRATSGEFGTQLIKPPVCLWISTTKVSFSCEQQFSYSILRQTRTGAVFSPITQMPIGSMQVLDAMVPMLKPEASGYYTIQRANAFSATIRRYTY